MMRVPSHGRVLIVEGKTDRFVLAELIERSGVVWDSRAVPVLIEIPGNGDGGVEVILEPGFLTALVNDPQIRELGVVVDADGDPQERWDTFSRLLSSVLNGSMVRSSGDAGFVTTIQVGTRSLRLGIWVMPNNLSGGMMETFLLSVIGATEISGLAGRVCDEAKAIGAPFAMAHRDKALIHTWLAWQDPPGQQLHTAVSSRTIPRSSVGEQRLVDWMRRTFPTLFPAPVVQPDQL